MSLNLRICCWLLHMYATHRTARHYNFLHYDSSVDKIRCHEVSSPLEVHRCCFSIRLRVDRLNHSLALRLYCMQQATRGPVDRDHTRRPPFCADDFGEHRLKDDLIAATQRNSGNVDSVALNLHVFDEVGRTITVSRPVWLHRRPSVAT